ncbi:lysophospholipid acyltransferase family protein [Campylobacter ureolyticus]|uniref:lysophospholipid acyltransferase family protein n=1 Tax=Campylobacter ureolyticus TaxID=827 RepID=UPI0022B43F58|nr:lysophospholipid acyltransferase family protein [Campylobacter ureolyticus]MCZ6167943.1 lysophospholipid acyltransferase family protein [Campylobacter ureolyticus]
MQEKKIVDLEKALNDKYPKLFTKYPKFISNLLISLLKKLFYEDKLNDFILKNKDARNKEIIDRFLKSINFTYKIDNISLQNIPKNGRVIFISNHPLGGLDALSLMHLINGVRKDVKILANEFLMKLDPISDMLIPIDNISNQSSREAIKSVDEHLKNEGAIIIFPAGEVSRAKVFGIKDLNWKGGFLKFAKKAQAPIVPIFVNARNSSLFYAISAIYKPLAGLLLGHEVMNKKNKSITIKIGEMIPYKNLILPEIKSPDNTLKLIQRHLYNIGKNRKTIFKTQRCLVDKVDINEVYDEVLKGLNLGKTRDGKEIYLCKTPNKSALLTEIGRLRELTFRRVGEGTGKECDVDEFDLYYEHLVLFDTEIKEIVGAYRIGVANEINPTLDSKKLYTQTLFSFKDEAKFLLKDSIELGRSFVQPKFWGTRALDYLWYGIGAYIKKFPETKYMFGPVSISANYPKTARDMMIYFYKKHFTSKKEIVVSKNRYFISQAEKEELDILFCGKSYEEDFKILKESLANFDLSVPTLYKQYSELCDEGGVEFLDFGIDTDFEDCADGFILVQTDKIKEAKRKRYIGGLE